MEREGFREILDDKGPILRGAKQLQLSKCSEMDAKKEKQTSTSKKRPCFLLRLLTSTGKLIAYILLGVLIIIALPFIDDMREVQASTGKKGWPCFWAYLLKSFKKFVIYSLIGFLFLAIFYIYIWGSICRYGL